MTVSLLSPYAALAGLLVLVPLGALFARERHARRVRGVLGAEGPPAKAHVPVVASLLVAFGLLAAAAAQPVVRTERTVNVRTDAEAFVVFDISRSMLASASPDEPQRIDRAIARSLELRKALGELPVGVATLTNRALPNLFPTTDRSAFAAVVQQSIGVNRPPGTEIGLFRTSTDFAALKSLASENYYGPNSVKRLVILLTDGESSAFAPRLLVEQLERGGVDAVVMRFWDESERVWGAGGVPEPLYRPTRFALAPVDELARLTGAGRVFGETELAATAAAVRAAVGTGETVPVVLPSQTRSIAPWLVLAACVPFALLLLGSGLARTVRRRDAFAYSMLARWRASSTTGASRSRRAPVSQPRS
jgi:hypothetical protein